MGQLRNSAVKIVMLYEGNVHLDIIEGPPCIRNANCFRTLATSHPNHAKMPGHHFQPRRNVETVQPNQVKYPLTHCRLNDVEEEKDDFDVALQIP
jgi:hypothetical protein